MHGAERKESIYLSVLGALVPAPPVLLIQPSNTTVGCFKQYSRAGHIAEAILELGFGDFYMLQLMDMKIHF